MVIYLTLFSFTRKGRSFLLRKFQNRFDPVNIGGLFPGPVQSMNCVWYLSRTTLNSWMNTAWTWDHTLTMIYWGMRWKPIENWLVQFCPRAVKRNRPGCFLWTWIMAILGGWVLNLLRGMVNSRPEIVPPWMEGVSEKTGINDLGRPTFFRVSVWKICWLVSIFYLTDFQEIL